MSLIVSGSLDYFMPKASTQTVLNQEQWFCEAVLWTDKWLTRGGMAAKTECQLLCICAVKFQDMLVQQRASAFSLLREYASMFVEILNEKLQASENVSDCDDVDMSAALMGHVRNITRQVILSAHTQTFKDTSQSLFASLGGFKRNSVAFVTGQSG